VHAHWPRGQLPSRPVRHQGPSYNSARREEEEEEEEEEVEEADEEEAAAAAAAAVVVVVVAAAAATVAGTTPEATGGFVGTDWWRCQSRSKVGRAGTCEPTPIIN